VTAGTVDVDAAIARASARIDEAALIDALGVLADKSSPNGAERALALDVAAWGRRAYADLEWEVDELDSASANLFARSHAASRGPELAIYSHLDTTLTGEPQRDFAVTAETAAPEPFRIDRESRTARGSGIGVAKAPAAAAIVATGCAAAALREIPAPYRLTLLLAAGGTHRAAPTGGLARFGRGVRHALDHGWRPSAVLNAKGGPAGVLLEEPAAAYLRVRLRRTWSAALARRTAAPDGGLARHAGVVLDAIESWRERYLARHGASGQLAAEIAVGAIRGGLPEKPDLLPGLLEIYVYAVLLPDQDPSAVARDLAASLEPRIAVLPGHPTLAVDVYASAPGGATDPSSAIAILAERAWSRYRGERAPVRGWTGATDGGIFMAAGIPTARLGPTVARDGADPRVEIVELDELVAATRAYAEIAVRYFAASEVAAS
jgi:acetylornithine deacetylase/succinyl-diaminopimelate desuccinylase-like protein